MVVFLYFTINISSQIFNKAEFTYNIKYKKWHYIWRPSVIHLLRHEAVVVEAMVALLF